MAIGWIRARGRWAGIGVLFGLAAGCATVQEGGSQTLLMKATHTKMSAGELRAHTDALSIRVPAMIEAGADEILAKSSDPTVRRGAILWKAQTIPAFYQALFRPDPLAAAIDGYTLSIQLEQALENGTDRAAFGAEQPIAVATARSIRALFQEDFRAAAKSPAQFDKFSASVEEWARAHPIEGLISTRQTMIPSLAQLAGTGDTSVFEVVGSVDATLADLATRIDVYTAFIPKQVHWQVELMSYEASDRVEFRDALATLRSLHQFSDTANALFSPEGVRANQKSFFEAIDGERIAALGEIDAQRVAALEFMSGERKAAFEAISAERRAVFGELDREKLEILRQVEDLRGEIVGDVNRAIDRAIWRIAELFAAVLVAIVALTLLVLRRARRSRTATSQPP